jgi:hypothetical protein
MCPCQPVQQVESKTLLYDNDYAVNAVQGNTSNSCLFR